MSTRQIAVTLDDIAYTKLEQFAEAANRDASALAHDWLIERLSAESSAPPTWPSEIARMRERPIDERRTLAREACGSMSLPAGVTAAQWVSLQRDDEWAAHEARIR